jgi:hypothetical protein
VTTQAAAFKNRLDAFGEIDFVLGMNHRNENQGQGSNQDVFHQVRIPLLSSSLINAAPLCKI